MFLIFQYGLIPTCNKNSYNVPPLKTFKQYISNLLSDYFYRVIWTVLFEEFDNGGKN